MKNQSKWKPFELYPVRSKLPESPCVYAVYFDGKLVYVGQTNRLSNRFSGHAFRHSYGKEIITPWCEVPAGTKISIKARFSEKLGDWAMREIRLISRLKPLHNRHHRITRKVAS